MLDPAGQRIPNRGSRGISSMKDKLMYSIILAYLVIAAVLTYLAVPDTFYSVVWKVANFVETVNYTVNLLLP